MPISALLAAATIKSAIEKDASTEPEMTAEEKSVEIEKLKQAYSTFRKYNSFKVGDIVEYKPGMRHKNSSGPFIVIEVLNDPIISSDQGTGSPYFREPLDIICGRFAIDGDFIACHYDSRRFQRVEIAGGGNPV